MQQRVGRREQILHGAASMLFRVRLLLLMRLLLRLLLLVTQHLHLSLQAVDLRPQLLLLAVRCMARVAVRCPGCCARLHVRIFLQQRRGAIVVAVIVILVA